MRDRVPATHLRPSCASRIALEIEEGAGKAGCPPHPRPPCNEKSTGQEPQVRTESSGLPCAMVLRLIARSPREPGLIAPVVRKLRQIANLASASGGQDHTPLPSASAPFVRTKNSRTVPSRPSQPASRPVTIGQNVPLASRRDAPTKSYISEKLKWN